MLYRDLWSVSCNNLYWKIIYKIPGKTDTVLLRCVQIWAESLVFLWNLRRNSDIGTYLLFSSPITSTPIPNLHCQKKFSLLQFNLCYTALLLLLLLSSFSRVRLCAIPQTAAHQASPSLGFSRQEHWSGLPFPFPVRKLEKFQSKVKSESEVAQSRPTLSDPMDCSPPGSSVHVIFQARVLEWGAIAFSSYAALVTSNSLWLYGL